MPEAISSGLVLQQRLSGATGAAQDRAGRVAEEDAELLVDDLHPGLPLLAVLLDLEAALDGLRLVLVEESRVDLVAASDEHLAVAQRGGF